VVVVVVAAGVVVLTVVCVVVVEVAAVVVGTVVVVVVGVVVEVVVVTCVVATVVVEVGEVVLDEQPAASMPARIVTTKTKTSAPREDFFAIKDGDFMIYSPFQREVQVFPPVPSGLPGKSLGCNTTFQFRYSARRVGEYLLIKWYHIFDHSVKILLK
jgi:hypothetical protein